MAQTHIAKLPDITRSIPRIRKYPDQSRSWRPFDVKPIKEASQLQPYRASKNIRCQLGLPIETHLDLPIEIGKDLIMNYAFILYIIVMKFNLCKAHAKCIRSQFENNINFLRKYTQYFLCLVKFINTYGINPVWNYNEIHRNKIWQLWKLQVFEFSNQLYSEPIRNTSWFAWTWYKKHLSIIWNGTWNNSYNIWSMWLDLMVHGTIVSILYNSRWPYSRQTLVWRSISLKRPLMDSGEFRSPEMLTGSAM